MESLSPYRTIAGMELRLPFSVGSGPVGPHPLAVADYVGDIADVYGANTRFVRALKAGPVENRELTLANPGRTSQAFVGDFIYVLRPQFLRAKVRPGEVSTQLVKRAYDDC